MSTEILIHISAPSRVQDDSRYRKQAEGYLGFKATRRLDLSLKTNASPEGLQVEEPSTNLPAPNITDIADDATTTDGSSSSSSQGAAEVDKNSPNLVDSRAEVTFDNRPFSRLDLTPAQSRGYLSSLVANGNSRTPTVYVERTPIVDRPRTAPTQVSPAVKINQHQRSHSDCWQTPPSVIPDSQPSPNSLKRSLPPSASFSSSTYSASPLAKRQRLQPGDRPPSSGPPSRPGPAQPHEARSPEQEHLRSRVVRPSSSWSNLASQPPITQIRPPPPETSMAAFDTHVTPYLALIESQLHIRKRFRPSHIARSLRVHERGYWQLRIGTDWSVEQRRKFWSFLVYMIREGKAGWGVWCESYSDRSEKTSAGENLEGDVLDKAIHRTGVDRGGEQESSLENELVRVYCWGELVPYIYLVLFTASDKMIKKQVATWRDAGGEEVVRMDPGGEKVVRMEQITL